MSPVFHRRNLGFGGIIVGLVAIFITIGGHYGIVVCLGLIGVVVSVLHFRRELNRRADDIVINSGRPHVAAPQKTAYRGLFNLANGIVDSPKLHGSTESSKVGNEEISVEKSGFIEADDMNRRSSFTPGSLKQNSNSWKTGLGSGSTGLGRRHSINLHGGRPNVSYLHAASPAARSPVSVRLSPAVRTGGLFSPNVLNELSDNGGTNGRSPVIGSTSGLGATQKQPLPKVHRVRDQDESYYGSPLNSPSHSTTPRATQQAQYSLLGLLPQVRLDRPNKPVLAERNRNMGRVTVKIAPPDTLKLNQTGSRKLKDIREEKNQKPDDILTILRERRKRTATDDEDGDSNTTSTEDHMAKRRRQGSAVNGGMDQSVTKSVKEMDLSPTSLNLKRRALHDRSPDSEITQGAEKRFKPSVKRAGSCVNEIQASYSSSRKLRQSNSRQSSLASSRRSSFSQSMVSSDPGLDQSELSSKLTQKAAPSVEMTEGSCSPSISNTSAVSTPASSITGIADDQGSTDSTIAKRLLRASPAFGAHLAKDKVEESPREKQKPVMLKNESSVKRRQGSLLITNNDDYSKMKTAQYPVSHEDLEKDRKLAEERVQKMLQKAQKSTSDSDKLKKSLFGELPSQSPVSTASTSGSAVSSSAPAAVTASTSAFTLAPPTVITSSVASAFAEGKKGTSVAATTASSASVSTTDTTPKLTLTTGGLTAGGLTAGSLTAGGLTAGGLTASSGISGSLTSTTTLASASATVADKKLPPYTAALKTVASTATTTNANGPTTIDLAAGKAQQTEAPKSFTAGSSSAISFGTATTSPAIKGSLFGSATSNLSPGQGTTGLKMGFTFGSQGKKDEPAASQVKQEEPKSSFAAPGGGFAFGAQTQVKKEAAVQPAISQPSSSPAFPSVFSSVAPSAASVQGMPTTTNAVSSAAQQPSVKVGGTTGGAPGGGFAFGNTSGPTNSSIGSLFGQKSATPAFNAVFGQGSANSSTPAAVTQSASTNSVFGQSGTQGPGVTMFGQSMNSAAASTSSTSIFGQNAPPASTSSTAIFGQNVNPTPAPASATSIFGQSGDKAKESIFGQNASAAPKVGTATVFGQPNTNSIFGQSVNASKEQASRQENKPTSGFPFGQNGSAQPAFGAVKPSSNTSGTGFAFQSTSTANTSFGAQSSSSNSMFAFGSSGSAANTGGTSKTNSVFGTSQSMASPFGANTSSTSNLNNPFQPKASAASNPAPAAKTSLFQFGNTTPAKETTKTNTSTNAPFAFGGAPASTASQSGASPFTFGQNTQAKPAASSSNGLFQFGGNPTSATNSATTTQSGVFGASQPMFGQSNSTTGGVFGSAVSTSSSAPAPAFGQVASNAGSFSSPPAFPAPAQQPAPGGFNFQSAVSTPANKGFNFTASANQQSSPAAFQFGQNSSTPAFGGSPASFASPTPSQPQMFSLGAGSSNPRSRTTQRARRTRPIRK